MKRQKTAQVFIVILSTALSSLNAAPPPSSLTPDQLAWKNLSNAAQKDLSSKQTAELMESFLKKFPKSDKMTSVRYMLAENEFRKENYERAAVLFERFVTMYPQDSLADSAAYRVGECYYNLKAYNSALASWDKMAKSYKASALVPNAFESMALLRMKSQEWGKADEQFESLHKSYAEYGNTARVRENEGIVEYHLKDYADAEKKLEGLESIKASYYRGLSLFELKLYENAVNALKNVVFEKSGMYVESAVFLKAEGFFQKKNYNIATAEFQSFLKDHPRSSLAPYAELRIAACSLFVNEGDQAIRQADSLLARKPAQKIRNQAIYIKGCALMQQKKYAAAADVFSYIDLTDQPALGTSALIRKAWAHKNLNQDDKFDATLKTLEEKFPSNPEMPLVRFLQGAQQFERGKWEDAGGRFEAAVLRYPYSLISESAMALMTISYTRAKRLDQLVTASNSALKILEANFSSASPYWRGQSYYFIGKAYFSMGRYKDAVPFFEKVTIRFSDHALAPRSQLLLAWCLIENKQYPQAREKAATLTDNKKTDPIIATNALFLVAVSYFNAKQYNEALPLLSDFVKAHPTDSLAPHASYLIGLAYHQKKVFGSAIDAWNECANKYPDSPFAQDAYLHIGDLYFKSGKFTEAADMFKKFHDRWPNSKYAQLAHWQEVQSYFNGKKDEQAIVAYPIYIAKYPQGENVAEAKNQLEMVYFRRGSGGDPEKLDEFLRKFPQSPFAPVARYKLGEMAMQQEKWTIVVQQMEQFMRDYPNDQRVPDALLSLGMGYENTKMPEKAIIQYRHLMNTFPNKQSAVDAAFHLGSLYFTQEKYAEALDAFNVALKKKGNDEQKANVYYNIALCNENLGQLEKAAEAYKQFADISKNQDQVREALMTGGALLKKAQKYDQAIPYFQRLLKDAGSSKTELEAITMMAECYKAANKDNQAIDAYEKLIAVEPANSDLRLAGLAQLAFLYEKKNALDKAVRVYEKISISEGKADWVNAAQERIKVLTPKLNPMP